MDAYPKQFIYTEELYKLPGRVLVLLPVPWETLSEDHIALLTKILGSVRLSLAGVQLVCREKVNADELDVFNPSVIISFGSQLHPTPEMYSVTERNGIRIIQSDPLNLLDDTKKKSLWNALKQAFT